MIDAQQGLPFVNEFVIARALEGQGDCWLGRDQIAYLLNRRMSTWLNAKIENAARMGLIERREGYSINNRRCAAYRALQVV